MSLSPLPLWCAWFLWHTVDSGGASSPFILMSSRTKSSSRHSRIWYSMEAYPLLRDLTWSKKSVITYEVYI